MAETFNMYSHRPKIYYILIIIAILKFVFLITARVINLKLAQAYSALFIILISCGLLSILLVVLLPVIVTMYIVDGELSFSGDSIVINSIATPFKNIKKIEINANDYRGARASDGSGNWIELSYHNKNSDRYRFVIDSKEQRENLRLILKQWNAIGVNIDCIGYTL